MPKYSHEYLQNWYTEFKKQVYEKANIDMDQKADLCRLKIFYPTEWTLDDVTIPKGVAMYACVPHEGTQYTETPPSIRNAEEYLQWMMDKAQVPMTDEEIEKLHEQSREGMLVCLEPGQVITGIRQIYTDENGKISVSQRVKELEDETKPNVPDAYKMPVQPDKPEEPNPAFYGLADLPERPKEPENMNPSFWSWLAYRLFKVFGIENDYTKKLQYDEDMAIYEEELEEWANAEQEGRPRYEEARAAYSDRLQAYYAAAEEYKQKPLGRAYAVMNALQHGLMDEVDADDLGEDGLDLASNPASRLRIEEAAFFKKQHSKLPQGKILTALDKTEEQIGLAKRTNKVLNSLLSHDAVPDTLVPWIERGVFKRHQHNLTKHPFPKMVKFKNATMTDVKAFNKLWEDLFEIAGFAALSRPDVIGKTPIDGFTAEETATLNYSMLLNDLITAGRGDSDKYMVYLEPARAKASEAIQAYYAGEVGPMAELLRNSIRMTNKEAANLSSLDSEHAMNTLHIIGRMWNAMEYDKELMQEVGLTPEEMEETRANAALHSVMQNGFVAKQKLLEHALYKRTLSAEEIQSAACDLMLAYQIKGAVSAEHAAMTQIIGDKPGYAEAAMGMVHPDEKEKAINRIKLIEGDRPGFAVAKKLLDGNWIPEAKDALRKNCNLDLLSNMSREEMGKVITSEVDTAKALIRPEAKEPQNHEKVNEQVRVNEEVVSPKMIG